MMIGCCAYTEDLRTVMQQGYDTIELSASQLMSLDGESFQRFSEEFRASGFNCVGFNSFCGAALPLVGPEQNMNALYGYMASLCRRGALLGIRQIGIGAPEARNPPLDWTEERSDEQMRSFLRMACETAAPYGIRILLEALNGHVCMYLCSTEHAARLVRELDLTNLGLVLDTYHVRLSGEDVASLGGIMPLVRHLHVSGGEPGEPRTFPTAPEEEKELRNLLHLAAEHGCGADSISVEADRRFLKTDGKACLALLRRCLPEEGRQSFHVNPCISEHDRLEETEQYKQPLPFDGKRPESAFPVAGNPELW